MLFFLIKINNIKIINGFDNCFIFNHQKDLKSVNNKLRTEDIIIRRYHDASIHVHRDVSFSNQTFLLTQALIHVPKRRNVIEHDSRNPHYKNRFASLEATLTKINPTFAEFGLVLSHCLPETN